MKLRQIHFFIGLVILLASACKKDVIEIPESNTPVFRVDGLIDGEAFELIAGDNNVYMHTMTVEEYGVNVFSGRIGGDDLSIEIGVYDGNIDFLTTAPQPATILPVFSQVSAAPLVILSKDSFENAQNITSIVWSVDGVEVGVNTYAIYERGIFDVCAEVTFVDGSDKTMCDELMIGYNHNANCELNASLMGGGIVNVAATNATQQINFINWYVNGVPMGQSLELVSDLGATLTTVTADVHFKNGVVRTKSVILSGYDYQKFVNDFTMFENESDLTVPQDFNIRVKVMKNGQELRSDQATNVSSKVHITALDYYGLNSAGNKVFKVSGIVNGNLKELASGEEVDFTMNIVFGIEIN